MVGGGLEGVTTEPGGESPLGQWGWEGHLLHLIGALMTVC